jgi:hypothetical protein
VLRLLLDHGAQHLRVVRGLLGQRRHEVSQLCACVTCDVWCV